MQLFPLFIRLQEKPVLLVGGGDAAFAKYRLLKSAGALVHIVATELVPEWEALLGKQDHFSRREFQPEDLKDKIFVVVTTGHAAKDQAIAERAKERNIPVNVVDRQELGDVVMPSLIDRAPVTIAISTDGASPVLAQRVRAMIEEILPANFGRLAGFARRFRTAVAARITDIRQRRFFWDRVFSGPIGAHVMRGEEDLAHRELIRALNRPMAEARPEYHLIEIADWEDLTLREARLLRNADCLLLPDTLDVSYRHFIRREAQIKLSGQADPLWIAEQLCDGKNVLELRMRAPYRKAIS